jgi:16S rRNA (guanine(966)-N(2))-methyltransferase RsmD
MSMIAAKIPLARVIDPMAGSGALALEALSRGAQAATLADCSPRALKVLKENIARLKAPAQALLATLPRDFKRFKTAAPFDLLFLDPPYEKSHLALDFLAQASQDNFMAQDALAIWEQAPPTLLTLSDPLVKKDLEPWVIQTTRVWGQRAAAILTLEAS